jgi:hypothetical protein
MTDHTQQGLGRREFIMMTSGSVLAAMAMGQARFSSPAAARPFSLGYAEPDATARVDGRFLPNVVSADRVSSSDGGFLRGVRVSIRGANVTPKAINGRKNMQLITDFTVIEGGTPKIYPFIAWNYNRTSGAGQLVTYLVPIDQDQHLRLLFKTDLSATQSGETAETPGLASTRRNLLSTLVTESAGSGSDPDAITLSVRGESGATKLQRGYYIIAPTAAGTSEPDWSRFQIRKGDNGLKLYAMSGFEAVPADFEYLILQLDYPANDAEKPGRNQVKSK